MRKLNYLTSVIDSLLQFIAHWALLGVIIALQMGIIFHGPLFGSHPRWLFGSPPLATPWRIFTQLPRNVGYIFSFFFLCPCVLIFHHPTPTAPPFRTATTSTWSAMTQGLCRKAMKMGKSAGKRAESRGQNTGTTPQNTHPHTHLRKIYYIYPKRATERALFDTRLRAAHFDGFLWMFLIFQCE